MVAIRHWDADKFIVNLPAHVSFYLFYGSDPGLISERARSVVRRSVDNPEDPFAVTRMEGDEIAGDPGRLSDEVNTIGLFGGRRAIWVKAGARNLVPAFEETMSAVPRDATVVVEAGALKKDSALRKLFEREKSAAAVECAHDTPEQLRGIIEQETRKSDLSIERETAEFLSHSLGADRLTTRAELEKLLLYKYGETQIRHEDVTAVVADAAALNLDAAINAAFSGRLDLVDETLHQAFTAGNDPGMLIGMASRHAVMLHRARLDCDRGVARDGAIEKAARRAFIFTQKNVLLHQVDRWTAEGLARALEILGRALPDCRKDARLAETIVTRCFWSIASAARRGRGG